METWQPCTVTLRGLVDENHPILLLIYRAMKDGRQGRTRTYVVSSVAGLQPAAFATQRHLTKNVLCSARRTGLEPAGRISPHGLTARYNTILLTSEQSTKLAPNQLRYPLQPIRRTAMDK